MKTLDDLYERLHKVEELLKPYLEPNTRKDMDRLEQRLKLIELQIDNIKAYLSHV